MAVCFYRHRNAALDSKYASRWTWLTWRMPFLLRLLELDVKLTRRHPPTGGDITAASRSRDCVIVTSDKRGGQSVWQHGERSTDKCGFTDGGRGDGMLWECGTQVLAAWQTAPDGVADRREGEGRASCSGGASSAAEGEDWESQMQKRIQTERHGGSRNAIVKKENRQMFVWTAYPHTASLKRSEVSGARGKQRWGIKEKDEIGSWEKALMTVGKINVC